MAGIVTKGRAIIPPGTRRSPGVREDARVLRQSTRPESQQTGRALETIQTAVDRIHDLLSAPPSAPEEFFVTDPSGNLLFWVGSRVIDGKTYRGLAATEAYIGGVTAAADPSTAVIICDADGVRINGATIKLVRNGVTTTLNNDLNGYPDPIGLMVKSTVGGASLIRDGIIEIYNAANGQVIALLQTGIYCNGVGVDADHFSIGSNNFASGAGGVISLSGRYVNAITYTVGVGSTPGASGTVSLMGDAGGTNTISYMKPDGSTGTATFLQPSPAVNITFQSGLATSLPS